MMAFTPVFRGNLGEVPPRYSLFFAEEGAFESRTQTFWRGRRGREGNIPCQGSS